MQPANDPSILVTLAEISVALAGFSAIVVLFRRRDAGSWLEADADRFHGMILHAAAATFFCFLPSIVGVFSDDPAAVWGLSSAVLATQILAHVAVILRLATTDRIGRGLQVLGVAAAGGLWLNVFGIGFQREFGPYLLGVLWHVGQSAVLFVLLIWIPVGDIEPE